MEVDLSDLYRAVAQVILDDLKRNPLIELPSGARMPQGVAGRPPVDVRLGIDVLDMALEGALGSDEDRVIVELADASGVAMSHRDGRYIEGRPPILAAFALPDEDRTMLLGEVLDQEFGRFIDPETGEEHRPAGYQVLDVLDS